VTASRRGVTRWLASGRQERIFNVMAGFVTGFNRHVRIDLQVNVHPQAAAHPAGMNLLDIQHSGYQPGNRTDFIQCLLRRTRIHQLADGDSCKATTGH